MALTRWPARRVAALAVALLAMAVLVIAIGRLGRGQPAGAASPDSRTISVTAPAVRAIDLSGVPGVLTVVGTSGGRARLSGVLHWTGPAAPRATSRLDHSGRVVHLSYSCAPGSPCTENYRLLVPGRTTTVIRQPSGHVIVSDLAGPLRIRASSVDVSATRLRCAVLTAQITSGHLSARFDVPPRSVSITLTSAQATVWLPSAAGYAVRSQVSSGYVHVGVPRAAGTGRTVTARIDQGELQLLRG